MVYQTTPDEALVLIQTNLKTASSLSDFDAVLTHILKIPMGTMHTRVAFLTLIHALRERAPHDVWLTVGNRLLQYLTESPSLSSSYIEQTVSLRELIAEAHEANEDFGEAARLLAEIPLETSQRRVSDEDKSRIWIRIMRNYLEVDDPTAAEAYLNKLKNVIFDVTDPALQLHFKLSQARINDARRQFLAASQAYHDISFSSSIADDERLHTLAMAIKCAILAPAGPLRSRALGRLYKDERASSLREQAILEKMFLDRLVAPAEIDAFAKGLQPHQLATTADGSTVLARAMVEHNLLAASRLYVNISLDALGELLGLDAARAEETTARMIEQGRLGGHIDQLNRCVCFDKSSAISQWDSNVLGALEEVEAVIAHMQKECPHFVSHNLVA